MSSVSLLLFLSLTLSTISTWKDSSHPKPVQGKKTERVIKWVTEETGVPANPLPVTSIAASHNDDSR